jgi:hypothetical protein
VKTVPSVRWGQPAETESAVYHAVVQDGIIVYIHDYYQRTRYLEIILSGGAGGQLVVYCDSRQDSDFCC